MEQKISISKLIPFSGILAAGFIIAVIIGGIFFYSIRALDNSLSVTGSATREVTSDSVKWDSQISRNVKVSTLKAGYAQMATDIIAVSAFLKDKGITQDQITISPVFMDQNYNSNQQSGAEQDYTLRQTIEVNSQDVQKITDIAKSTKSLIDQGVVFSTQSLQYFYSKLPDTRVELLSDAVKDAQARAGKLAESSGKKVGSLKAATIGVVQVLPVNSVDVSDYGTYDTSQIQKEVMVTVRASFTLK